MRGVIRGRLSFDFEHGLGSLAVGLEVGGYNERPDWPKMGPSLLIAPSPIVAIRTAKWPATFDQSTAHPELDKEIEYATFLASRVMSTLMFSAEAGAVVSSQRGGCAEVNPIFRDPHPSSQTRQCAKAPMLPVDESEN